MSRIEDLKGKMSKLDEMSNEDKFDFLKDLMDLRFGHDDDNEKFERYRIQSTEVCKSIAEQIENLPFVIIVLNKKTGEVSTCARMSMDDLTQTIKGLAEEVDKGNFNTSCKKSRIFEDDKFRK